MKIYPKWDKYQTYNKLAIVDFHGDLFCAVKDVPEEIEISDVSYWLMIEANGTKTNHERYQMILIENMESGTSPDLTSLQTRMQTAENNIQEIQSGISDLSAGLTDAENLISSLEDWQDDTSGAYVVNGGGDFNWPKFARGAYLARADRAGETEGIRLFGQYEKEASGYNLDGLIFSSRNKQIFHQRYNADTNAWTTVATYMAEVDTGWIDCVLADGVTGSLKARLKNGVLEVKAENTTIVATAANSNTLGTLPDGITASNNHYFPCCYVVGASVPPKSGMWYVTGGKNIIFRPEEVVSDPCRIYSSMTLIV